MGVGPGRIAKVRAYGEIGAATATREAGDQIGYRVELPVSLTFEVDLQVETHRFEAELLVPLTLTAVARPGVHIFIEATPPRTEEVQVELQARACARPCSSGWSGSRPSCAGSWPATCVASWRSRTSARPA